MNHTKVRGFTLVEMIVVIVIISILMAIGATGVIVAMRSAKMKQTESTIRTLEAAVERYKNSFRVYPPTSMEMLSRHVRVPNQTNLGAESMVACLSTEAKGGPFYTPPTESESFCNTDNDALPSRPTGPYYRTSDLLEYADPWSNPISYVHYRDYGKPVRVVLAEGEANWRVPVLSKTKTFPNKHTFIIISAGPDGKLGTDDDLTNY